METCEIRVYVCRNRRALPPGDLVRLADALGENIRINEFIPSADTGARGLAYAISGQFGCSRPKDFFNRFGLVWGQDLRFSE